VIRNSDVLAGFADRASHDAHPVKTKKGRALND
jgi:hypothetical protein